LLHLSSKVPNKGELQTFLMGEQAMVLVGGRQKWVRTAYANFKTHNWRCHTT